AAWLRPRRSIDPRPPACPGNRWLRCRASRLDERGGGVKCQETSIGQRGRSQTPPPVADLTPAGSPINIRLSRRGKVVYGVPDRDVGTETPSWPKIPSPADSPRSSRWTLRTTPRAP